MSELLKESKELLSAVKDFISTSPWRGEFMGEIDRMIFDIDRPCELAVIGTVKAGKSSFINALLGEDLAVVNVTEATATINYFKYAEHKEEVGKVFVVYTDGTTEWRDKEFLDSLQGNTPEVLRRSEKIDHLEFYVDNRILKEIVLIDTPGTASVVEQHSDVINDFGAHEQRERNIRESVRLMGKADAVVLLVARVPKEKDEENAEKFTDATNSYNSLGVMSKIDIDVNVKMPEWKSRCNFMHTKLKERLHSIQPVSIALYRTVSDPGNEDLLREIHKCVNSIDSEPLIRAIKSGSPQFSFIITEALDENGEPLLPLRAKELVNKQQEELISRWGFNLAMHNRIIKAIPFPTVRNIILTTFYGKSFEEAKDELLELSGFDNVLNILDQQFFSRAKAIRCNSILERLDGIFSTIERNRIEEIRVLSENQNAFLYIVNSFSQNTIGRYTSYVNETQKVKRTLENLIIRNCIEPAEIDRLRTELRSIREKNQSLLSECNEESGVAEGLQILATNRNLFTEEEIEELEVLFGKYPERKEVLKKYGTDRDAYWERKSQSTTSNYVKRVSEFAFTAWSEYNFDNSLTEQI